MCGLSLVKAGGCLTAVASLVVKPGLLERRAAVVAHTLSCSQARGIVLHQGSNPCPGSGRQILNHWTTSKVPTLCFNKIASDSDLTAEALESQKSYSWETRSQD